MFHYLSILNSAVVNICVDLLVFRSLFLVSKQFYVGEHFASTT